VGPWSVALHALGRLPAHAASGEAAVHQHYRGAILGAIGRMVVQAAEGLTICSAEAVRSRGRWRKRPRDEKVVPTVHLWGELDIHIREAFLTALGDYLLSVVCPVADSMRTVG